MEEELISKKDVLKRTGISYGQFYRWKRKGLIPEPWFIRKSTFTGQETFLPREEIMERIERIKQFKDDHSLDEIFDLLYPEVTERTYNEEVLRLDEDLRNYYDELRDKRGNYGRTELIHLAALEEMRRRELSQEEIELALLTLLGAGHPLEEEQVLIVARKKLEGRLIVARKQPYISFSLICPDNCVFDPQTEVVVRLKLGRLLEEIRIKMREEA